MKLLALNFEESFGKKSKGREHQRIVNKDGNLILGTAMWKAGDDAVTALFELAQPIAGVTIQDAGNSWNLIFDDSGCGLGDHHIHL